LPPARAAPVTPALCPPIEPPPRGGFGGGCHPAESWGHPGEGDRDTGASLLGQLEEPLDVGLQLDGGHAGAVASERFPLGPHQELLEVPGDVGAAHGAPDDVAGLGHQVGHLVGRRGQVSLQVGEDGVGVLPVHLALLEEGEVGLEATPRPHVLQAVEDLLVGAVLLRWGRRKPGPCCVPPQFLPAPGTAVATGTYLVAKLVAGEAQHDQPPRVPGLQLVELGVIPRRGGSERRHVLDEDHAAPEDVEVHLLPLQGGGTQVVEGLGDGDGHGCGRASAFPARPSARLKGCPLPT